MKNTNKYTIYIYSMHNIRYLMILTGINIFTWNMPYSGETRPVLSLESFIHRAIKAQEFLVATTHDSHDCERPGLALIFVVNRLGQCYAEYIENTW